MDRLVTANRFLKGHRLRVVITPQFYPLFSVNPQTGAQEFESDSVRVGEIRIVASKIVLPVVEADRRTGGRGTLSARVISRAARNRAA